MLIVPWCLIQWSTRLHDQIVTMYDAVRVDAAHDIDCRSSVPCCGQWLLQSGSSVTFSVDISVWICWGICWITSCYGFTCVIVSTKGNWRGKIHQILSPQLVFCNNGTHYHWPWTWPWSEVRRHVSSCTSCEVYRRCFMQLQIEYSPSKRHYNVSLKCLYHWYCWWAIGILHIWSFMQIHPLLATVNGPSCTANSPGATTWANSPWGSGVSGPTKAIDYLLTSWGA